MPITWSGRATKTVSAAALSALLLTTGGTPAQRKAPTVRLPLHVPVIFWAWSLRKPGLRR